MMQKHIINIFMLLLSATAVLSCSKDMTGMETIEISGKVMDAETEMPIEDIRITVQAMKQRSLIYTTDAYTDDTGEFVLLMDIDKQPSSVIVMASDADGDYRLSTQELIITLDSSHNVKNGIFFINNCNFYLSR